MDKRTELEIQRDKYEAVIEERDALISSLRGENEKLKRDLESERGFYREKVSQCDDLKKFIESQRKLNGHSFEEQPKYSLTLTKVKPNRRLSGTQSGL